ncbi:hypothetical protein FOPG_18853 [Fusarium oxysporum f. sp. conglutinans race 2 54008]|nr:hypothetical protein FOPG_18853 [Fusarium oxysporum f. sp. conglutinans race 2 54008]
MSQPTDSRLLYRFAYKTDQTPADASGCVQHTATSELTGKTTEEAYELQLSPASEFNTSTSGTSRDQLGFWWARHPTTTTTTQSIPPKIWQIHLPMNESAEGYVLDPRKLEMTASWLAMNTDYA